jgi:hypothetical protein
MLIRLFPKNVNLAGYLFAFLSSKTGYHQMAALTYGGAIPHFDETGMGTVVMPLFEEILMLDMSQRVETAMADRDIAIDLEVKAQTKLERAFQNI